MLALAEFTKDRYGQYASMKQVAEIRTQSMDKLTVLIAPFRSLISEIGKFGVVGLIGLVIDIGLFNLLLFVNPWFDDRPITAKAISVIMATTASYFLNRSWTYADRERTGSKAREYVLFFVFNGIAMFIALGCLWFSHYALGLTSPLADNISANVIGLALGTAFRFWAYRTYVFPEDEPLDAVGEIDVAIIEPRHEVAEPATVSTVTLPAIDSTPAVGNPALAAQTSGSLLRMDRPIR